MIDNKPAVLIVDLPMQEDASFRLNRYGIYALRRAHNNGLIFNEFSRTGRESTETATW